MEINTPGNWEFPESIYTIPYKDQYSTKISRCIRYSDRVWVQGPRGGVKIIKDQRSNLYGYVTGDERAMKEFMWVKLQAQPLHNYI